MAYNNFWPQDTVIYSAPRPVGKGSTEEVEEE